MRYFITIIYQIGNCALDGTIGRSPTQNQNFALVVSGINLLALKKATFRIGEALLQGTGPCEPCSRLEENLGPGGYNAMRGHGGICARVIEAGRVRVGDPVQVEKVPETDDAALARERNA